MTTEGDHYERNGIKWDALLIVIHTVMWERPASVQIKRERKKERKAEGNSASTDLWVTPWASG